MSIYLLNKIVFLYDDDDDTPQLKIVMEIFKKHAHVFQLQDGLDYVLKAISQKRRRGCKKMIKPPGMATGRLSPIIISYLTSISIKSILLAYLMDSYGKNTS